MNKTKEKLRSMWLFKLPVITSRILINKNGIFKKIRLLNLFLIDYSNFRKINKNSAFSLNIADVYPRIFDKTEKTHIDPVYFYQDTWCAKKIFENKPIRHYDVGSKVDMVGIISQYVPTTMIDIRPIELSLEGLSFKKGDITNLPFKNDEVESLSSICVVEHIGLGRYGDPLDPFGSERAASELKRVLAKNGNLYISVPIDSSNKVYFNAHRSFTREFILELFSPLELIEESYIYGKELEKNYDKNKGFGTGLFHFRKI